MSGVEHRDHRQRAGDVGEAERDRELRAEAAREPDGELRREDHADRDRQHLDAGLERAVAEHRLQVGGEEVHDAHQREEHERDRDARRAEAQVAEHADVEHRVVGVALPGDERRDDRRAGREGREDHRAAPAALGRLDQGPDDGAEAGDRQAGAGQVDLGRLGVTRIRHEHDGADQARGHDGQVDQEDAAPGEVLDQEAAGDRSDRDAEPRHRGPDGDRLRPLVRREDVGQDRQRRGHDPGRAEAHERA